jgi:hypothetical protein
MERQDTTEEAARIQAEIHRRMGPAGRLALAGRLSVMVRRLALSRLRTTHPELSEGQIRDFLIRELYGVRRPAG